MFTVKKSPSRLTTIPMLGMIVIAYGWLSHAMIQLVDDGYHIVSAGEYFIFKLNIMLCM